MTTELLKIPPHDSVAEQGILGALLMDGKMMVDTATSINASDFYGPSNGMIFEAMQKLFMENKAIDTITVRNRLREMGILEKIGGMGYLNELVRSSTSSALLKEYCGIVTEHANRRRFLSILDNAISRVGIENVDFKAVLGATQSEIDALAIGKSSRKPLNMTEAIELIDSHLEHVVAGNTGITPTGLIDLDALIDGAEGGDLIVVGARPGMGKTAFANYLMQTWSKSMPTFLHEIEMSERAYLRRVLSNSSGIRARLMRKGLTGVDLEAVRSTYPKLAMLDQSYDFSPTPTITDIIAKSRAFKRDKNKQVAIIVDYLQLVRAAKRAEKRYMEVGDMTRTLKAFAKELDSFVVILSQLRRYLEGHGNSRPTLELLRESGDIEQDADIVLLLHTPSTLGIEIFEDGSLTKDKMEVIIAKARNGEPGVTRIYFNPATMRIGNLI